MADLNLDRVTISIDDLTNLRWATLQFIGGMGKWKDLSPQLKTLINQAIANTGPLDERRQGVYAFTCLCGQDIAIEDNFKEIECPNCKRIAVIGWKLPGETKHV